MGYKEKENLSNKAINLVLPMPHRKHLSMWLV